MEMAACAITAALLGADLFSLSLGLEVEAATAIASTVRIITGLKDVLFQNEGMSIEDESVHELIVAVSKISNINCWFWDAVVFLTVGSDTCDYSSHLFLM